jgi:hypothetical protein|tara:strand:- start:3816 stop:4040 length:225 start_codon:yes stop_codon:yes gene_type:complete
MNNIEHSQDKVDPAKVKEYAEFLIKIHKGFNSENMDSIMDTKQAIHGSIITAKELAAVTAKKFYYEVIQYLEKK